MKKLIAAALIVGAFAISGGTASAADYPEVANLKPFSPEANFMSLPGYERYLVYERDGVWMTRAEAVAVVNQQIGSASR